MSTSVKLDPRTTRMRARILALIVTEPLTSHAISAKLHLSESRTRRHIQALMAEPRRVHVAGHRTTAGNHPARLFLTGDLPDAVYVKRSRLRPCRVEQRKQRILKLLELPQTIDQLAARLTLSANRVRALVGLLRAENKLYIAGWKLPPTTGSQSPVYALGNLPNCKRVRRTRQKAAERSRSVRRKAWGNALSISP